SRAESIEDDSPTDLLAADALIEEYDSSEPGGRGAGGIGSNSSSIGIDTRSEEHHAVHSSSPQTVSSPILSLGSTASQGCKWNAMQSTQHTQRTNHLSLDTTPDGRSAARIPLSAIPSNARQCDDGLPPAASAHTPKRTPLRIQRQHLCAQSSLQQSPLRTITSHRQNISPQAAPTGRPLLSQRPSVPRLTSLHSPTPPPRPDEPSPTKRRRRMGAATTEFEQVVAQEVSGFCIWSHCLSGESSAQLVCHRPQECIRLLLHSAKRVIDPHLFSAYAHISEVLADEDELSLAPGQPIRVLLSFSVCLDAAPLAAERMASKMLALDEGAEPVAVAVYRPWRIQGAGEQR
ncbi:hypothetical protein H4R20_007012, partial [Coemansia guatemalensis]